MKSEPICKTGIDEHNLVRRGRLLQEGSWNETGKIQCSQKMFAHRPANFEIRLAADGTRVTKIRGAQRHVLKAIERIFRALAPEPYPFKRSGYVLQRMENELRLNAQQVCRPDQRSFSRFASVASNCCNAASNVDIHIHLYKT